MVTVDDATYVKMKDTLYWGDAWKASRAKAQIESNYSDEKYSNFLSQLDSLGATKQSTPTSTQNNWPADWYATASERNAATWGAEFISQTKNQTSETPAVVKEETKTETVTETPEIKQEWALKPLSQDYYDQTSQDAQDKIVKNLEEYKKSNPEYFTDYESFKKNFSYDARNDAQKNTLDQWFKWYQKWLQLSTVPTTDLYTQYKNWDISNADLEILRANDPSKYSELMNQINKGNIIAAYDDDKWAEVLDFQTMAYQMMQQAFVNFMWGGSDSWASQYFRDYEEKMASPEMMELSDQATEYENQIENLQDDIATMQKAVEKEYEWTWASRSKIAAIVADRTYELQLQLRTANSNYNKVATQYNNRMQQYQNEFQLQLQEYQINQQARQQQMQELWFAMDLMSFETPQQQSEREWEYRVKQQEYTNWNINSKDYSTRYKAALNSVQNLLSQYEWIPMIRSAEEMAQDILKAIDNWSDLGTELTKLNKQIQSKPEYKQVYNATFGTWTSWTWIIQDSMKVWDTEWVKYNGNRYTADEFNTMMRWGSLWGAAKPYDVVDESVFSLNISPLATDSEWNLVSTKNLGKFIMQKANWMKWWQCGKYVNDYLQYIGMTWAANRYYDDELSTKLNSINTYDPKVWTIAVFDYWHKSSDWINHGHVGIVTAVDYKNWTITVRDSNFGSDEKVQTRTISFDDSALKWFFDPSKPPMWSSVTTEEVSLSNRKDNISEDDKIRAESILKQIKTWVITPSDASKERDRLIEKWYGEDFQQALDKWMKVSLTPVQQSQKTETLNRYTNSDVVKDFKEASVQINNLITALNANNWAWDLAAIFQFMKVLDPSSVVREWEFKNAAKANWYANPDALWQNYIKHGWDGTWLTAAWRWNFAWLAKDLINSQAEFYNLEYGQVMQDFENAWIDAQWLPVNYADYILNKLNESGMQKSSNSFKDITLTTFKLPELKTNISTKSILQSKYGLK